ncbi:hypothetical protein [Vibrio bivalvicida]|uniref:Uncharacterized protein n=1 Tax=Vibrio bivalvicida TaxID=1276888 RepID=A0A177Y2Q1_9VIBR|nr:hypothetical protein [Vibrio bivalvicida]OAJ95110.1 hypothetical protein APB76_07455 [Vibrio bivalvicida]
MKFISHSISILLSISTLVGCSSIPQEAPELSLELGKRIQVLEQSNVTLLKRFFEQKRAQVDEFIAKEWIPEFAEQVFSNNKVAKDWNTIVEENSKHQRVAFLVKYGPKLQQKINQKRKKLIKPLDDLERLIEEKIRFEFAQARAINHSLTSFLTSASKIDENRERYLNFVGFEQSEMTNLIDKTDEAVESLLGKTNKLNKKTEEAKEYLEKMEGLRESL